LRIFIGIGTVLRGDKESTFLSHLGSRFAVGNKGGCETKVSAAGTFFDLEAQISKFSPLLSYWKSLPSLLLNAFSGAT